ncbi:uncharacterized protein AMSG_09990 [Thecamonas trahens ATCC 50062]|uniref:Uncharacterized protein n=1 Tax=Thecamonas trahens ATCC 50062 TaxID=461836 RepID=A0A0L0DQA0_THETB|nr:hypothetical protein AMSG_09990 [Thecamonas trahens ATCC 50062]KNC54201.1 hypothetical protein AMSG_09990 [Thecamonas trahens ATCC 50062]|eukprot:XP_013753841.1 hypothetical protein AMSG_09990 [Thecamonas trahens ATCC 50062]
MVDNVEATAAPVADDAGVAGKRRKREDDDSEGAAAKKRKGVDGTAVAAEPAAAAGAAENAEVPVPMVEANGANGAGAGDASGGEGNDDMSADEVEAMESRYSDATTKLLTEKIALLDKEIALLEDGSHDGFVAECAKHKSDRDEKVKLAEAWRNLQMENINNVYQAEVAEAETLFSSYQASLRKRMIDVVAEKRKRVEEERALHLGQSIKSSSARTLRKRGSKAADAAETATPLPGGGSTSLAPAPRISGGTSFALQEQEILEDLYLIQKSYD